jgi:hypothetical protein
MTVLTVCDSYCTLLINISVIYRLLRVYLSLCIPGFPDVTIGTYYEPEQLVFVDESAFDRRVSRRPYGWAPIGSRARRRDFFIRGKRCANLWMFHFQPLIFVIQILNTTDVVTGWNSSVGGLGPPLYCCHIQ